MTFIRVSGRSLQSLIWFGAASWKSEASLKTALESTSPGRIDQQIELWRPPEGCERRLNNWSVSGSSWIFGFGR